MTHDESTALVATLHAPLRYDSAPLLTEAPPIDTSRADDEAVQRGLARFVDEVIAGNRRFGLIAADDVADRRRLWGRHILDSVAAAGVVAALAAVRSRSRLYDLGTGAGLPGIPLAMTLRSVFEEVVLVDRRTKRVAFLRGAIPLVRGAYGDGAPAIRVVNADFAELGRIEGAHLGDGVVVFRAFQQTSESFLKTLAAAVPPGTPVCALKGRADRTAEEREILAESRWVRNTDESIGPAYVPLPSLPAPYSEVDTERTLLLWETEG